MKVSREDFERERKSFLSYIQDELNEEFGTIAQFKAGYIVDIDFEENKATGTVGVRMDNNFGVVTANSAVEFADALAYAARMARGFPYLGYTVA